MTSFSKKLCKYVISKQQDDLFVIFQHFHDRIANPENNTFFMQNDILDRMLMVVEESKKNNISLTSLYKNINSLEKKIIESLDLENNLIMNAKCSKILGIEYFDEAKFMEVLDSELESIATKYNLNAEDDYNKLYMFLSSLQLNLQSSDDRLNSITNQYIFFDEHSNNDKNDEFISIYGERFYKIDILKQVIDSYNKLINTQDTKINKDRFKKGR